MRCSLKPVIASLAVVIAAMTVGPVPSAEASADGRTPWQYIDNFPSKSSCRMAGREGIRAKRWAHYKCIPSPEYRGEPRDLWVR